MQFKTPNTYTNKTTTNVTYSSTPSLPLISLVHDCIHCYFCNFQEYSQAFVSSKTLAPMHLKEDDYNLKGAVQHACLNDYQES